MKNSLAGFFPTIENRQIMTIDLSLRWKRLSILLTTGCLAAVTSVANAAPSYSSIASAKVDPVPLYKSSDGKSQAGSAAASTLPWRIDDDQNDFYRVSIGGKTYWVDSLDVHADMPVTARCSRMPGAGGPVAADFGASSDRCK